MSDNLITLKEARERLFGYFDQVSKKKNGNIIARRGFFYRMGGTSEKYVAYVKEAFPNCEIVDSGEHWAAFRGGASLANQSHWYVEFRQEKE